MENTVHSLGAKFPPLTSENAVAASDGSPAAKKRANPSTEKQPPRELGRINYPKKRVSVACELCRTRKTRCDAKRPSCSFCSQIGAECSYRRAGVPQSSASATEEYEGFNQMVISRLDRIEKLLQKTSDKGFGSLRPKSPNILDLDLATASPTTSVLVERARHAHQQNGSSLVGLTLSGLSRLVGHQCPLPLYPLAEHDDDEAFLEREAKQGEALFQNMHLTMADLDLSTRSCWRLQNSFSHNVLPWCPLFDQKDCVEITTRTCDARFPEQSLETCLTLFVLALGALTRYEHHTEDNVADFPGLDYFQVASRIVGCDRSSRYGILSIQCRILMGIYCLYCLRPVQAFDAIHEASLGVIALVRCKRRLVNDPQLQRKCYRAYWACYLLEHELQAYVSYSACLLQSHHDFVPLPLSDHDEPGMYWFLAEVAFRRIFSNPNDGIGWNAYTLHAPVVVEEIISQIGQWYAHLPNQLKFPFGLSPILDPHKVFLRGQYYSINAVLSWSHVVRLLTTQAKDEQEVNRDLQAASRSLEFAALAIFSVEPILQERHLLLLANLFGLYTQVMLLLCTYNIPALAAIQQPSQLEAIRKGRSLLVIWAMSPEIASYVNKIDNTMLSKGIAIQEHISPSSTNEELVRTTSHGYRPDSTGVQSESGIYSSRYADS